MSTPSPKTFISYRRADTIGAMAAHQIFDRLKSRYGEDALVFDVDTVPLGRDYREYLNRQVHACDVLLAVIGEGWLEKDEDGRSRLENPKDFVRIEIEAALRRGIPVIPVLVGNAALPEESDLPESIQDLRYMNGAPFRPGGDLSSQLEALISGIDRVLQIDVASGDDSQSPKQVANSSALQPKDTAPPPPAWQTKTARAGLLVGLDDYNGSSFPSLKGCAGDATQLSGLLQASASGEANFDTHTILVPTSPDDLMAEIRGLFKLEIDIALFYFAGHAINEETGYLVTKGQRGIAVSDLVESANESRARERIVILDCCSSNRSGELFARHVPISLADGTSILAIHRPEPDFRVRWEVASATSLICNALEGGGADLTGAVTMPGLYAYLNASGGFDQRVFFRASLSAARPLRHATPKVDLDVLRKIVECFSSPEALYQLSPAHEPTAEPSDPAKEATFGCLQKLTGASLVEPVGEEHMYFAAMNSAACRLTSFGQIYWMRVRSGEI